MKSHGGRKHSKFSASGAERWTACPGSVHLSEGLPDKDSIWSIEGTKAHEVLEQILSSVKNGGPLGVPASGYTYDMTIFGMGAAKFIINLYKKLLGSELLVETKVALPFIHPEMFGTFDGAIIDHFGTLHVFDYKYGAGHAVSPIRNLQMIFYGIGLAAKYDWNFKCARLWIIQPRIKGYDGPTFWDISMKELRDYARAFKKAVARVEEEPDTFVEGGHCHWCKAKSICPIKNKGRLAKAKTVFKKEGK